MGSKTIIVQAMFRHYVDECQMLSILSEKVKNILKNLKTIPPPHFDL